jgi:RNA polymerase sigma-70 factor (ECF subfamily)
MCVTLPGCGAARHKLAGDRHCQAMERTPTAPPTALARARTDPAAFSAFYDEEVHALLRFFARRLLDGEAALDLTAETFARAFAARRSFRGATTQEARAWLFTIAHRQLARYLRKGYVDRRMRDRLGVQLGAPGPDELARVEELADLDALRGAVAHGLRTLSPQQREAVELRVVAELPYPELARRLAISEPTARARVSRALRALRIAMTDPTPETSGGDA